MRSQMYLVFCSFLLSLFWNTSLSAQKKASEDYLLRVEKQDKIGFVDRKGKLVIPFGKYTMCQTDTFRQFAIVLLPEQGFVGINREEKVLFNIFLFENSPDPASEGLFRIIEDHKIGYASSKTGEVLIAPQFLCAYPFEDGKARVSTNCSVQKDGESTAWVSKEWFYIDRSGKKVKED